MTAATQALLDLLSTKAFGVAASKVEAGVCVRCHTIPDASTFTPEGRAEFAISRICEPCFDTMFAEGDE